jgi:hypothetical protein
MNYDQMSDFEINVKVHILNGGLNNNDPTPNYCNNPSDAWPLIVENKININWFLTCDKSEPFVCAGLSAFNPREAKHPDNPLRAAMVVYLKMKESSQ